MYMCDMCLIEIWPRNKNTVPLPWRHNYTTVSNNA